MENQNNENQSILSTKQTIFHSKENNQKLTPNILTLGHLRIYLNMKFLSLRRAGQEAGLSYSRIKQIVTGKNIPSKPELIQNIAISWDIDPIKLTQLFERMKERGVRK